MALFDKNKNPDDMPEKLSRTISAVNSLNKRLAELEKQNTEYIGRISELEKQNREYTVRLDEMQKRLDSFNSGEYGNTGKKLSELENQISMLYSIERSEKVSVYLDKIKKASQRIELIEAISGDRNFRSEAENSHKKGLSEKYGFETEESAKTFIQETQRQYRQELKTFDAIAEQPYEDESVFRYSEVIGGIRIDGYEGFDDKNIIIPDKIRGLPVVEIASEAFYNCKSLKSIKLPSELKIIGLSAFWGTGIEVVKIPGKTEEIAGNAFNIHTLGHIQIPDSVMKMEDNTFFKSFFGYNGYNVTIYCKSGSYAMKYARDRNIRVRPFNEFDMLL